MKASTIRWHLARDNQIRLAKFCQQNAIKHDNKTNTYNDGTHTYFEHTYHFDNGGYITAEMLQGDTRGYSIADYFQVVDYNMGTSYV